MQTSTSRYSTRIWNLETDALAAYRLYDKMLCVPRAESYDEAVVIAKSAFESELAGVHNSRISFSRNVPANGNQISMGISPMAWTAVMSHLEPYEIIDVHVQPEILCHQCLSPSEGNAESQQGSSSQRSSSTLSSLIPRKSLFRRLRR
ncbi:hypothetical protein M405DRAFT_935402 [Rhizopogon salebrosus TDB-379]|nr:hypothetical protein M405DRAFT_935402 [Rhizopogon salebrosus TDB-379]